MVLSEQEESLISVVRALPPEEAGKVLDWARQLADLAGGREIEWSDAWTDEDVAELKHQRPLYSVSTITSGKTVEARRRRRWRLSRRARNQDSPRSCALDGRLPSAQTRCRGRSDYDTGPQALGSH
jgi:hypothetical protein